MHDTAAPTRTRWWTGTHDARRLFITRASPRTGDRLGDQRARRPPETTRTPDPGRTTDVLADRHRQPRRGRDAAHPRGARPQRAGGSRRAPHRDGRAAHRGRAARRCSCARPTSPTTSARPSDRPYLDHAVLETALRRDRGGRRLGRLGVRRRGPDLRRAVRADRGHLHRPEPRGDAPARRQDRLQADRRGGRRPGRAVEPRRGRHPRGRDRRGRRDRLPAHAQGDRRRWRARHPHGRVRRRAHRRLRAHPRRGASAPSAPVWSSSRGSSPVPGTSRSRSSPTARAPRGRSGCATARSSAATRRSSRSRPRRCSTRSRSSELKASRPSGSPSRSGTPVPAPSSSSTTRATGSSPSSRSTPGSRSSTPSPRSTTDTDLVQAADPRRLRRPARGRPARRGRATPSRPGSTPRTPTATSPRRRAASPCSSCPPVPGIRVDTGVGEGDSIPADFDSMIAKIIAHGRDRDEALARLRRAMRETTVVIEGGATNKSFILDLLDQPEVIDGIGRHRVDRPGPRARAGSSRSEHSGVALVAAGIEAYEDGRGGRAHPPARDRARRPTAGAARRRPGGRPQAARYGVQGHRLPHRAAPVPGLGDQPTGPRSSRRRRPRAHRTRTRAGSPSGAAPTASSPRPTARSSSSRSTASRTASAATRVACCVLPHRHSSWRPRLAVGDEVAAGAPVLVLESMKMETVLPAPFAARRQGAARLHRQPGRDRRRRWSGSSPSVTASRRPPRRPPRHLDLDLPAATSPTAIVAAADGRARRATCPRCSSATTSTRATRRPHARRLPARRATSWRRRRGRRSPDEIDLLDVFADFAELSRNRPVGEEAHLENRVHSPREHFHTYLQSLDPERGALPDDFVGRLERVLRPLRRDRPRPDPELEEAVFRVFLAQQRSAPEVPLATSILQRWIVEPAPGRSRSARRPRGARPARLRHPAALPRRRRPRAQRPVPLVRPAARRRRPRLRARVGGRRARAIDALPEGDDRTARIDALAAIPEQIVRFLGERLAVGVPGARADARRAHQAALPRVRPARPARGHRRRAAVATPTTPSTGPRTS